MTEARGWKSSGIAGEPPNASMMLAGREVRSMAAVRASCLLTIVASTCARRCCAWAMLPIHEARRHIHSIKRDGPLSASSACVAHSSYCQMSAAIR